MAFRLRGLKLHRRRQVGHKTLRRAPDAVLHESKSVKVNAKTMHFLPQKPKKKKKKRAMLFT
ncbi:MAG: hypothetical protein IJS25_05910 [Bacteroidales bacterium]|nr:hypothetical protein [Bacteroidales bacterium]